VSSQKKTNEDLGIKLNTPKGAAWERILESQEGTVINSEINVVISKKIIELAKEEIEKEKQKL
jgi:hypothetical protein